MLKQTITSILAMSCAACANFSPLTKQTTVSGISATNAQWLTYDSSRRGTLVLKDAATGRIMSCAEPAPDTGFSFTNTAKGNVGSGGTTVGAEASFAATLVALAGRDNLVLMTRESMFRLCEARLNGFISNAQYDAQFTTLLKQIVEIAEAVKTQSSVAQQALIDARAAR